MTDSEKQKLTTGNPVVVQELLSKILRKAKEVQLQEKPEAATVEVTGSFDKEVKTPSFCCPEEECNGPLFEKFFQLKEHYDKKHNRKIDSMADVFAWRGIDKKVEPTVLQEVPPPPSDRDWNLIEGGQPPTEQVPYFRVLNMPTFDPDDYPPPPVNSVQYDGVSVASADFQKGVKYDKDKPDFSLLPEDALWKLAEHYTKGAKKYEARNWEKGIAYSRLYSASRRHMVAWFLGEEADEEGFAHLPAAIFGLLNILAFELRGMGPEFDDRPTIESDYKRSL